jgi:hypothetical protein
MVSRTKKRNSQAAADFAGAFVDLRAILQPYAAKLHARDDTKDSYYLEKPASSPREKPALFGAAKINKNYISFHLMAGYCFADLLKGMSPELKTRKQGKACSNFTSSDAELFGGVSKLTAAGAQKFRALKIS